MRPKHIFTAYNLAESRNRIEFNVVKHFEIELNFYKRDGFELANNKNIRSFSRFFGQNLLEDLPDCLVIVGHRLLSHFLGGQIAVDRFTVNKVLEEDPDDLGVFADELLLYKEFSDGGHSNVVAVVYLVDLYPLGELSESYLHLIFLDDVLYMLRIILDLILEAPEEHS